MSAPDVVPAELSEGVAPAVYARAPYVGWPVYVNFAGEEYRLPARAPDAWWAAVRARQALRGSPQSAWLAHVLHDCLLDVLRFWRPGLSVLPERAGRLYRALSHVYGEGTPGG